MKTTTEKLLGISNIVLMIMIIWMMFMLDAAWKNERFLSEVLVGYTTNTTKGPK